MNDSKLHLKFHPILLLIFGGICISFAPVFVKIIGPERLGPTAMGFWRTFFGGLILFVITLMQGGRIYLSRRLLGFAALGGFIFFLDLFIWHRSVIYCGAGLATILGNTQVFVTAILSFLIFKEKLTPRFWIAALSAIVGVSLLVGLFNRDVAMTHQYLIGVALGLMTGVVYGNYLITMRWSAHREVIPYVPVFMAWTSMFSALFLGVSGAIESDPFLPPDTTSWLSLLALGLIPQALGWWTITTSLAKTVASRAGIVLLLQPTLAVLWGALWFSEQFTFSQGIGAAITLAAIYFGGLKNGKKPAEVVVGGGEVQ
jgi:drug/metabolite transporter (DMT)-like permease